MGAKPNEHVLATLYLVKNQVLCYKTTEKPSLHVGKLGVLTSNFPHGPERGPITSHAHVSDQAHAPHTPWPHVHGSRCEIPRTRSTWPAFAEQNFMWHRRMGGSVWQH